MIIYVIIAWLVCVLLCLYVIHLLNTIKELRRLVAQSAESMKDATRKALHTSRSVMRGQIAEHMFPLSIESPFHLGDMKFLGQPVDYVVFDGYSEGEVGTVYFVEVKTGKSALSPIQRSIRDAVDQKRVVWQTVHMKETEVNDQLHERAEQAPEARALSDTTE